MTDAHPTGPPRVVVGVPGPWKSLREIAALLDQNTRGWSLSNSTLRHRDLQRPFRLDLHERDPGLLQAFAAAGSGRLNEATLAAIAAHASTAYAVAFERGPKIVRGLVDATAALLEAGGAAARVETAGVAHGAKEWLEFAASPIREGLMDNFFVAYVGGEDQLTSCGMHAFELADATVTRLSDEDLLDTLKAFHCYQRLERPPRNEPRTFRAEEGAPTFALKKEPYQLYPPEYLFHNPFGQWRLSRLPDGSDRCSPTPRRERGHDGTGYGGPDSPPLEG